MGLLYDIIWALPKSRAELIEAADELDRDSDDASGITQKKVAGLSCVLGIQKSLKMAMRRQVPLVVEIDG